MSGDKGHEDEMEEPSSQQDEGQLDEQDATEAMDNSTLGTLGEGQVRPQEEGSQWDLQGDAQGNDDADKEKENVKPKVKAKKVDKKTVPKKESDEPSE